MRFQHLNVRRFSTRSLLSARGSELGHERIKNPLSDRPKSRQQKIDAINMKAQSKLFKVDNEFGVFDKSVRKVLDLGCVPGNWMAYTKFRLCQIHNLQEETFNNKCHVLGFDLLFGTPPPGISTLQGNIFSKMAHLNMDTHFKEIALRELDQKRKNPALRSQDSYYTMEQEETALEHEIERLAKNMGRLSVVDIPPDVVKQGKLRRDQLLKTLEYRPDLILSDLGKPFMQQDGFFNQTNSRPYQRYNNNDSLNRPTHDPLKASLDLADASLFLSGNLLRPKGRMVLRLSKVDHVGTEVMLLESRLKCVFHQVESWSNEPKSGIPSTLGEFFFICKDKKDDELFDLKAIYNL